MHRSDLPVQQQLAPEHSALNAIARYRAPIAYLEVRTVDPKTPSRTLTSLTPGIVEPIAHELAIERSDWPGGFAKPVHN